jgi:hypothetical protein
MLLFFKYNYFLKRKTAINVFFGSYKKGKFRTFNIETEPSYAETHPKTPTPTWIWWMLQPPFSWYDNVKQKYACKRNLCYICSLYLKNNNILTFNSLSNMLFLAVEQKYLHGWKAEMLRFYIYKLFTWVTLLNHAESVCFKKQIRWWKNCWYS